MRRKVFYSTLLVLFSLLAFNSCRGVYVYNTGQTLGLTPKEIRLDLCMDDFDFLGETTISVESRVYFGIFRTIDRINEIDYNFREFKNLSLTGWSSLNLKGNLKKAAYKVVEDYPDADYYVPVYATREVDRMFLGRYEKELLVIKAYKLK